MPIKFSGTNKWKCGKCGYLQEVKGQIDETIKCDECGNVLVNYKNKEMN